MTDRLSGVFARLTASLVRITHAAALTHWPGTFAPQVQGLVSCKSQPGKADVRQAYSLTALWVRISPSFSGPTGMCHDRGWHARACISYQTFACTARSGCKPDVHSTSAPFAARLTDRVTLRALQLGANLEQGAATHGASRPAGAGRFASHRLAGTSVLGKGQMRHAGPPPEGGYGRTVRLAPKAK